MSKLVIYAEHKAAYIVGTCHCLVYQEGENSWSVDFDHYPQHTDQGFARIVCGPHEVAIAVWKEAIDFLSSREIVFFDGFACAKSFLENHNSLKSGGHNE